MKNVFKWAKGRSAAKSSQPSAEDSKLDPPDEIPIPDIYTENTGDTVTQPALRILSQSPDREDEGFDPYDTATLIKDK